MTNRTTVLTVALVSLLALADPARPHHAFASVFDPALPLEVTGKVTQVDWMNPHIWFYLDIESDDGTVENWGFEMGSPNSLVRRGWRHDSLQVGEVVSVSGWRARDGSARGAVKTIVLSSGERLFGGQNTSR
jgi:hypothetical protein